MTISSNKELRLYLVVPEDAEYLQYVVKATSPEEALKEVSKEEEEYEDYEQFYITDLTDVSSSPLRLNLMSSKSIYFKK